MAEQVLLCCSVQGDKRITAGVNSPSPPLDCPTSQSQPLHFSLLRGGLTEPALWNLKSYSWICSFFLFDINQLLDQAQIWHHVTGMVYVPQLADRQAATQEVCLACVPAFSLMLTGGMFLCHNGKHERWTMKYSLDTLQPPLAACAVSKRRTIISDRSAESGGEIQTGNTHAHTRTHACVWVILDAIRLSDKQTKPPWWKEEK